jgi:hypothetical protein
MLLVNKSLVLVGDARLRLPGRTLEGPAVNQSIASCFLLVALLALPAAWHERPRGAMASSAEPIAGPPLAIRRVERAGDRLYLGYSFRRVEVDRHLSFNGPASAVECLFWDATGNRIDPVPAQRVAIREGFPDQPVSVFQGLAVVDVPAGAKFVALTVNHDKGKSSGRVAIPRGARKGKAARRGTLPER